METRKVTDTGATENFEALERRIDEHLQHVLPEDIYHKWTENFVLEQLDDEQMAFGYYGQEPLRKIKKEYVGTVWLHICSVAGYDKTLQIYPRRQEITEELPTSEVTGVSTKLHAAKLFGVSFLLILLMLMIAVIGCNYISNRSFREAFYSVGSLKADHKIRIIQISDLHNSTYGKENAKLIDRVKKLKPDLILYTGDCVEASERSFRKTLQLCTELSGVAPSYYVYGNNEAERSYVFGLTQEALDEHFGFGEENRKPELLTAQEDSLEEALEATGVTVLKNEMDTVTVGTTEIDIYGVLTSNPSAFWAYAGESFDAFIYQNPNRLKLTALHEPLIFEEFAPDSWGDIMICGHTHGGTVRLPVLGPLYTHEGGLFPERGGSYVYGRYEVSGSPLIISSGLENHNIFRINNPPELVIVDINRF